MYLDTIQLNNFWSYKSAKLDFTYTQPTLITGINGAGKTCVFEAILWCLFGRISRAVSADSVVNSKLKTNCFVSVQGHIDGRVFDITRYRNHSKHKNQLLFNVDGKDCRGASTAETQTILEKELRTTYSEMLRTSFFIPNSSDNFCGLTDAHQKALFQTILNLDILDDCYKATLETIKDMTHKLQHANIRQETYQAQLASDEAELKTEQAHQSAQISPLQAKLTNIQDNRKIILDRIEKVRENQRKTSEFLETAMSAPNCVRSLQEIAVKLAQIDKESLTFKTDASVCPTCLQPISEAEYAKKLEQLELQKVQLIPRQNSLIKVQKIHENNEKFQRILLECGDKLNTMHELEQALQLQLQTHSKTLEQKQNKITTLHNQLQLLYDVEQQLTKDLQIYTQVKTAFSNTGLKSYIINTIVPLINENLKKYTLQLTNGQLSVLLDAQTETNKGELRNKLSIKIKKLGGTGYETCSAGEAKRVDICMLFALLDVMHFLGKAPNFIILDELFDNLDNVGLDRCIELLHTINYANIFVISHNESLKGYFQNNIYVEKTNELSQLYQH